MIVADPPIAGVVVLVAAVPVAAAVRTGGAMAWAICTASVGTLALKALDTLLSIVSSVAFTVLVMTDLSRLACAMTEEALGSVGVLVLGVMDGVVVAVVVIAGDLLQSKNGKLLS